MKSITIDNWTDEVLALYRPPLRAAATWRKMGQALREFAAHSGARTTADLTPLAVARWLAAFPARTPNTARSLLGSIRAACSYAVAVGYLGRSPFAARRVWIRPGPRIAQGHHPREAIGRVLARLRDEATTWRGHRLWALATLVAYTGLRRSEALMLRREDVDCATGQPGAFPGPMLRVVGRPRLKTVGSAAPVPIPPAALAALQGWLERPDHGSEWVFPGIRRTKPWTGGPRGEKPLDQLKAAGVRAGIHGLTFQSLRHSWATHAESAWGIGELAVQRILRHTTPLTQRHYRHADLANLAEIARRVSYEVQPAAAG